MGTRVIIYECWRLGLAIEVGHKVARVEGKEKERLIAVYVKEYAARR